MSDHHEAQDYKANGPTDIGFRTGGDGTGIVNGVVAEGTQFGVYGIGRGERESSAATAGVYGESKVGYGVWGYAKNSSGVFGTSGASAGVEGAGGVGDGVFGASQDGVGVRGFSSTNDGVVGSASVARKSGVFGDNTQPTGAAFGVSGRSASPDGAGVNGFSDAGVGVRGSSKTNDGVVGSSSVARKSGVFGDNTQPTGAAFGVSGRSASADGAGVNGFSDHGYGGHFSGVRAPLRLQPSDTFGRPTTGNHQIGELFVDKNGELFFCKHSGTPGTWFLVQLIPA